MRILIALNENKGKDSLLSEHFGHCPYFGIYETTGDKFESVKNNLDHSNPDMTPVDQTMLFKPDIIFSKGMGQRAIDLFNKKDVKIRTGNYKDAKEVIFNLRNLDKLNMRCNH